MIVLKPVFFNLLYLVLNFQVRSVAIFFQGGWSYVPQDGRHTYSYVDSQRIFWCDCRPLPLGWLSSPAISLTLTSPEAVLLEDFKSEYFFTARTL
jgi:hypothetical protein